MGLFGISEDHLQNYQSLDDRLIRDKASTFFFEASGDAMWPLIFDKDILIVDRSLNPTQNSIVVASFEGELICKSLHRINTGGVALRSYNSKHKDIFVNFEQDLQIFGVVTSVVRDLRAQSQQNILQTGDNV